MTDWSPCISSEEDECEVGIDDIGSVVASIKYIDLCIVGT